MMRLQIQTKRQSQGSLQVNSKKTRQFYIIWSGMINWVDCIHIRYDNVTLSPHLLSARVTIRSHST
jgi:hypothetical protein